MPGPETPADRPVDESRPGASASPADDGWVVIGTCDGHPVWGRELVDREPTCPPVPVEISQPIGNRTLPYVCPNCGRASWHPRDAAERYCGYCHDWA